MLKSAVEAVTSITKAVSAALQLAVIAAVIGALWWGYQSITRAMNTAVPALELPEMQLPEFRLPGLAPEQEPEPWKGEPSPPPSFDTSQLQV